ncbi:MAG: YncE family protein [candidate division WOR-3 bacterium]
MRLLMLGKWYVLFVLVAGAAPAQHVETTLEVGRGPVALAFDSVQARLYVANQNSNSVSVVDAARNQVIATIPVGDHPTDIVVNPSLQKAYVCCAPVSGGNGSVYIINTANNSIIDSVQVGQSPHRMVWDRTDNLIFVLNRLDPSLSVIDCNSNQVVDQRRLIQVPEDILWNSISNKIYVTSGYYMQPGRVFIIDAATRESLAVVASGQDGYRLAFNPVQNRVYSGNKGNRSVTIIDGQTNSVIRTTFAPSEPWAMAWVPEPFNKLFVGNYWKATTSIMRGNEVTFFKEFAGTTNPYCFAYNPRTLKLFCACYLVGRVAVIDVRDGHEDVHDSITVGNGPAAIAVYQDSNRIFIANSWDSTLTVLRDYIGIEEQNGASGRWSRQLPTFVRGMLELPANAPALVLFDQTGRSMAKLVPGVNDLSRVPAGVYFACPESRGERFRLVLK